MIEMISKSRKDPSWFVEMAFGEMINSLTSAAYFILDYRGWGAGWSTGNCLRFNLIGANAPVDAIRAIQPSSPSGLNVDSVEFLFVGNVDA